MTNSITIAHRGLDETYPENTLVAFKAALERGMAIEIDVRATSDEQLVVVHDDTVDRTTDGSGVVADITLAELKRLDAGSWWGSEFAGERIPTLNETLDVVRDHGAAESTLFLEMKALVPGSVGKICRGLEERGLFKSTVGFGLIHLSVDVRRRFYEGSTDFQCATVANVADEIPAAVSDPYSSWIYARFPLTANDVQAMHAGGKRVIASGYGVMDDIDVMVSCAKAGADAIMSYHPVALEGRLGR